MTKPMDLICLRELKLETVIGTHAWERRVRQNVSLDLEIAVDTRPAAASDRLADALDYAAVARRLDEFVSAAEFHLIEALAEACARIVIAEFGAAQVRLTVHKPGAVRAAADVALRIERSRADYR
jgi:dihydroneopterin aldolase